MKLYLVTKKIVRNFFKKTNKEKNKIGKKKKRKERRNYFINIDVAISFAI